MPPFVWAILARELGRRRPGHRAPHPLDDPLDRAEWQGLAAVFEMLARRRTARARREEDAAPCAPRAVAAAGRRHGP